MSFSDKTKSAISLTLKENKKVIENQNEVGNILNEYFFSFVSSLQIPESNNRSLVCKIYLHFSLVLLRRSMSLRKFNLISQRI